jgi:hypothetical protein
VRGIQGRGGGPASCALPTTPSYRLPLTAYRSYAVKLLPHPHPPLALGLLNVNPDPCIEVT